VAWTEYQIRAWQPAYIERDRDTFLEVEAFDDGALSAPSSGTITVYNGSGTVIVNAQAVTIASSKANYTISAATVAAESYGDSWRVEWSLVMADTNTHVHRQNGALVRVRLAPVIADADLLARHSDLSTYLPASNTTGWEDWILEAWREVQARLESMGRRPYLILSPEALRPVHLYTTLEIVCRSLGGSGDPDNRWNRLADFYREEKNGAWAGLNFVYDEDDSGGESDDERTGGMSTMWLAASPRGRR
jgi:hypothetical protein